MKGISLWQPLASAMMHGTKQNETRSWPTDIRGDVVICSAKRKPKREECFDEYAYRCATAEPLGFCLVVVDLFDCVRTESLFDNGSFKFSEVEMRNGNYTNGRFAWLTRNPRPLVKPIPVIGRQGWFNLPIEIEQQIMAQLIAP
jgi:hypothetical protein